MNIILKQSDIEKAVNMHLRNQMNLHNKQVAITFTTGRKGNGISAEVEISDLPQDEQEDIGSFADFLAAVSENLRGGVVVVRSSHAEPADEKDKQTEEPKETKEAIVSEEPESRPESEDTQEEPEEPEHEEVHVKPTVASLFG